MRKRRRRNSKGAALMVDGGELVERRDKKKLKIYTHPSTSLFATTHPERDPETWDFLRAENTCSCFLPFFGWPRPNLQFLGFLSQGPWSSNRQPRLSTEEEKGVVVKCPVVVEIPLAINNKYIYIYIYRVNRTPPTKKVCCG